MDIINDFVNQWLNLNQIPMQAITLPCKTFDWMDLGLRTNILKSPDHSEDLNHWLQTFEENTIYHIKDGYKCNYTIYRIPQSKEIIICGPVLFDDMQTECFDKICEEHHLPKDIRKLIQTYYSNITYLSSFSFYLNIFSALFDNMYGKDNYEIIYYTFDKEQWFQQFSYSTEYNENSISYILKTEKQYEIENTLIDYVTKGNEAKAMETYAFYQSYILRQNRAHHMQDIKNFTVSLNTLFRKAALDAGIHPVKIEQYSVQIMKEIEQTVSIDYCYLLQKKMIKKYCQLVQTQNLTQFSKLIQKIIIYIDGNLQGDLTLSTLAKLFSITPGYLSAQFRKETGHSLTDFVNRRRIDHAQKMLLTCDTAIKSIAEDCGISDIYYFSRLFKKITGTTPKAYRQKGTYTDFQAFFQ